MSLKHEFGRFLYRIGRKLLEDSTTSDRSPLFGGSAIAPTSTNIEKHMVTSCDHMVIRILVAEGGVIVQIDPAENDGAMFPSSGKMHTHVLLSDSNLGEEIAQIITMYGLKQ